MINFQRKAIRNFFFFSALFVIASCGNNKELKKYFGTWNVQTIYGTDVSKLGPTVEFRGETTVFGYSACNHYSGTYAINEEKRTLSFASLMATEMACEPERNNAEQQLLRALNNTQYFLPKPEGIYLLNAQRKELAFIKKK